jgi:hypothetical protein
MEYFNFDGDFVPNYSLLNGNLEFEQPGENLRAKVVRETADASNATLPDIEADIRNMTQDELARASALFFLGLGSGVTIVELQNLDDKCIGDISTIVNAAYFSYYYLLEY